MSVAYFSSREKNDRILHHRRLPQIFYCKMMIWPLQFADDVAIGGAIARLIARLVNALKICGRRRLFFMFNAL